ncbi:hypothetical protein D3C79_945180 [compost metagenome]
MRGTVDQRPVRIVEQPLVILAGDTVDEQVRVIAGVGHHSQNAAGARIAHHHCRTAAHQQLLDIALQVEIQR